MAYRTLKQTKLALRRVSQMAREAAGAGIMPEALVGSEEMDDGSRRVHLLFPPTLPADVLRDMLTDALATLPERKKGA